MNVFSLKKPQEDKSKSILKALDTKKNLSTRLKHLKYSLGNLFCHSEANFKLKDKSASSEETRRISYLIRTIFVPVPRQHKEEFEVVLLLLEKLLCFMPEMIQSQWQMKKLDSVLSRLLHPGNVMRLRKEAIRLFILYYQVLGDSAEEVHHATFATLIPGFSYQSPFGINISPLTQPISALMACSDLQPVLPSQSAESQAVDTVPLLLEFVLHFMVSEMTKVMWKENRDTHWWESFNFVFDQFKKTYLMKIFPTFSTACDIYNPSNDIPEPRQLWNSNRTRHDPYGTENGDHLGEYLEQLQVHIIKWIANYVAPLENVNDLIPPGSITSGSSASHAGRGMRLVGDGFGQGRESMAMEDSEHGQVLQMRAPEEHRSWSHLIVRETLYSSRDNVNLVHEIFRQAFLLSPVHVAAVRVVVSIYRDWITRFDNPPFILEPVVSDRASRQSRLELEQQSGGRLRTNSYVAALTQDFTDIRAGLQNTLQVFLTHSSAVFMTELPDEITGDLLEDQVDVCKRVLNIYRYTVMNTVMSSQTWEQFLLILLQIVSTCLRERPPQFRKETLGGRLAAPLFQTLIVTWIRASLHVAVSSELWDQLLHILSSLVEWEELIVEWGKTMETLTRVMARYVYGLDLGDLPLDRMTAMTTRKRIIRRGQTSKSFKSSGGGQQANSRPSVPNPVPTSYATRVNARRTSLGDNSSGDQHKHVASGTSSTQFNVHGVNGGNHHHRQSSSRGGQSSHGYLPVKDLQKIKRSYSESNIIYRLSCGDPHDWCLMPMPLLDKKSRSAESFRICDNPSSVGYEETITSRTLSPSPSSGVDSASLKETLQLDIYGRGDDAASECGEDGLSYGSSGAQCMMSACSESRSVMAGGTISGWTPDSTMMLWKRMLGCMGNVTMIPVPNLLHRVFVTLVETVDTLVKMRENLGVSEDKQSTPPPPPLVPPLLLVTPWCIQAIDLEEIKYRPARILSYEILCKTVIRRPDVLPIPRDVLIHFYRVMHLGLVGKEEVIFYFSFKDIINQIVKQCGACYWSITLPGHTLLLLDFIFAADSIISSNKTHGMPRHEAVTLIGSLVCCLRVVTDLPALQPNAGQFESMCLSDVKDRVISILLKAGRREPSGMARGISLCALGIFVYEELTHYTPEAPSKIYGKIRDALYVILQSLKFQQKSVIQLAADLTLLFCDHSAVLWSLFPDVVRKIIEALCNSIEAVAVPVANGVDLTSSDEHLVISLLLTMGEWAMSLEPSSLVEASPQGGLPLLKLIFKTLDRMIDGRPRAHTNTSPPGKAGRAPPPPPSSSETSGSSDTFLPSVSVDDMRGTAWSRSKPVPGKTSGTAQTFSASVQADSAEVAAHIRLAARGIMDHLVQHLWHFPLGLGAAHLGSLVMEPDDGALFPPGFQPNFGCGGDVSMDTFSAPNVQFFAVNNAALVSMVQLPNAASNDPSFTGPVLTPPSQVRFIARHLGGKTCWDANVVFRASGGGVSEDHRVLGRGDCVSAESERSPSPSGNQDSGIVFGMSGKGSSGRIPLSPQRASQIYKEGNVQDLLSHIGKTSPECVPRYVEALNYPEPLPSFLTGDREEEAVTAVLDQRTLVLDFASRFSEDRTQTAAPASASVPNTFSAGSASSDVTDEDRIAASSNPFQLSCFLLSQLGWASWHRRPHVQLLKKTDRLLLEIKNLDQQRCRDKHKIAIIYVGKGQEDKRSILCNVGGSQDYEEFVAGLAWEVELENHVGFLGGLHYSKSSNSSSSNPSCDSSSMSNSGDLGSSSGRGRGSIATAGETAPYFSTSLNEVIFHVATRMPSNSDDALHMKTRHLGNDEVHIVWSEHTRDYHRGIFPTEFCDVLIVIYPLAGRLYRIRVDRKSDVPFFGPLFDGAIVDYRTLPGLVRATAINASRAKRSTLPHFANFFVERARSLEGVFNNYIQRTSFEDFSAQTYCPNFPASDASSFSSGINPGSSSSVIAAPERKSGRGASGGSADGGSALMEVLRSGPGRPPRRGLLAKGGLHSTDNNSSPPNSPKFYK
ncbi:unnamed protein product [Notodromas monacha]|uniref:Rap-GAP domain-containing protein n=1 Tax=Notodromas monacha TaxID=399045 RepID=A0A7R9GBD1_9CRUS|nr:unnamed protein product [Notodromas monacha]CAG0914887.1 unnamed protein product [Notodromas monacha]